MHVYEVRPREDKRGVDLISDVLPYGRLLYGRPNAASDAVSYARHYSRSHDTVYSRLRWCRQRDRNARAQGRFLRVLRSGPAYRVSVSYPNTRSLQLRFTQSLGGRSLTLYCMSNERSAVSTESPSPTIPSPTLGPSIAIQSPLRTDKLG